MKIKHKIDFTKTLFNYENTGRKKEAVPKVMSVALIELVEMTATLNVVVSINSTTVMQYFHNANGIIKNQFYALPIKIRNSNNLEIFQRKL